MAQDDLSQDQNDPSPQATPAPLPHLDITHTRARFTPLRDAFLVERDQKDFISLYRVTADTVRALIYIQAHIEFDFLLRSLAAEFLPYIVEEIGGTPAYYPEPGKGEGEGEEGEEEGAWKTKFPVLEAREDLDHRYCALSISSLMADTCPSVAKKLSGEEAMIRSVTRLMWSFYIRATNPLKVVDGTPNHEHILSGSSEPKTWKPQWKTILAFLVLLAIHESPDNNGNGNGNTVARAVRGVMHETRVGAEKVKVKEGDLSFVIHQLHEELEANTAKNEDEQVLWNNLSKLMALIGNFDGNANVNRTEEEAGQLKAFKVGLVEEYYKDKDQRMSCSGCGKLVGSEKELMQCGQCRIILYCSSECQSLDWKRYHKETCSPLGVTPELASS